MKIIIVGGGIAGLSTYLHLRKHLPSAPSCTIAVYESHKPRSNGSTSSAPQDISHLNLDTLSESTAIVGGGLAISPNGIRVLRDLDPELHTKVVAQGFPVETFVFKGANGWTLGMHRASDKAWRAEGEQEEVCIASTRHGLRETIMQHVRQKYGDNVVQYRKVLGIERSKRLHVRCVDESGKEEVEEADLVIGADGVKSVVRSALFGAQDEYQPTYTGLAGVGGFLDVPIPAFITSNKAMVFTFGGNGFFGYSSGGPPSSQQLMWWSTFETATLPDTTNIDAHAIKTALLKRHTNWRDPILQDIIQKAEVKSLHPTWTLPELPQWGERGIVLVGDAAHAMDPTTGQGASQALEDAQTLALLLARLVQGENDEVENRENVNIGIKLFYQIRAPRIHAIVERGKKFAGKKANVGVVKEYFMYCFLWLMMSFPAIGKAMLGDVNRELYTWSARQEVDKALEKYRRDSRNA
ncbi:hypothetical protein GQ44DRAFT_772467 [Phaeosphaeriaceae sp. PMI808]|nr:hypothetical protein GQ44DRAFT_772467 [Phaeosphaeriaceae sp. PMI808]